MCYYYPGIRILMVRVHYPELEQNLIQPILRWVPIEDYRYNGTNHQMTFNNGSVIKFGHYDSRAAENEYQGTEYDIIFLEEATQLSERAFKYLQTCIRSGSGGYPKRMYLTCNPGGVGHHWVKRLFIDRRFKRDFANPEADENPADYTTIRATVEDNPWMLKNSPMYLKNLASLPPDLMRAHRYGDWNALSGAYFSNFHPSEHTFTRFKIPQKWNIYRSFDYGLDCLAVCWFAVDEDGRCWCYREVEEPGLVVRDAARMIVGASPSYERVTATYAPPDMWNHQKDTGKTMAEVFMQNGLSIVKADNNRVQGHMLMKDMLSQKPLTDPYVKSLYKEGEAPATLPGLMFFNDLEKVIEDISSIQADEKNPNDCAKDPHDVTHTVDAVRYFCINRSMKAEKPIKKKPKTLDEILDGSAEEDNYEEFLCGGEISEQYMYA